MVVMEPNLNTIDNPTDALVALDKHLPPRRIIKKFTKKIVFRIPNLPCEIAD